MVQRGTIRDPLQDPMLTLLLSAVLVAQNPDTSRVGRASAVQWQQDVDFLARRIPEIHPNPYHAISRAAFAESVAALRARIPQLSSDQRIASLLRLVALNQDGHNGIAFPCGTSGPTNFPFRFRWDTAGIFVESAAPGLTRWVGARMISMDGHSADRLWAGVLPTISHDQDNIGKAQMRMSMYLTCGRVMHGLGLIDRGDRARFRFEKDGVTGDTIVFTAPILWWSLYANEPPDGWAKAYDSPHPPLWLSHVDLAYWSTYLADRRALFVQVNEIQEGYQSEHNLPKESLADFWDGVRAFVDTANVDRLIIDVRRNGGGNNYLLKPIIVNVVRATKIDQRGHLFVLTSPQTFSAAQNLVNRLQIYAEPTFVGAPTGENVNFYSDADDVELPNTKLVVAISSVLWQDFDQRDTRHATTPQLAAPMTFDDYVHGRDAALELALTIEHPPSISDSLRAALPSGYDAVLAAYRRFVAAPVNRYAAAERETNLLGYALVRAKQLGDAILVFRANVAANPRSSNAWDSLADGYARAGLREQAIVAYREALRLNPRSESTRAALDRLIRSGA
jgi:tetratricopeptide (TPR) repeat protein